MGLSRRTLQVMAHRQLMTSSLRRFAQDMFLHMHRTPYIFGRHHLMICEALDSVVRGECTKLIINIAPRYGKTELVSRLFIAYGLAINPESLFLNLSYSTSLVQDNSMAVKAMVKSPLFRTLFKARVGGRDTQTRWSTEQGGGMYAVSTLGQITGFGAGATDPEEEEEEEEKIIDKYIAFFNPDRFAGAVVIDDPLKPEDALSDNTREQVNRRFETTIRNRVNSRRTPIIIICQRTHERDLCGYLQSIEPDDWKLLSIPVISYEDGKEAALWPHKHTLEELHKIEAANAFVFETQYMQNPRPLEGLMYAGFKTYDTLPVGRMVIKNYTDTADTGADWLCSIDYAECADTGECYVLDVLFTDRPMEFTEPETARMATRDGVELMNIESNNGGRGFARAVEKNLRAMGNARTRVAWFSQTGNKDVRIFSHSAEVQNLILFPTGWERLWPQFHMAVTSYRKVGRNAHDDAPDVLTGIVEKRTQRGGTRARVNVDERKD